MAFLFVIGVIFLICSKIASSAYCDVHQIPFPGLQQDPTRLYLAGESFFPSCIKGYKPAMPNGKLTCKGGVWSGHFPPCVADDCKSPPPSIEHGKLKSVSGQHTSKAEYVCDDSYHFVVESSVHCYFGEWKGTPPVCKESKCNFADLKKKEGILPLNGSLTSTGEKLRFRCESGYAPTSVEPLCSRGSWVEFGVSTCKENDCIVAEVRNGALMQIEERQVFKWKKLRQEQKTVLKKAKKGSRVPAGHKFQLVCENKYSFEGKGLKSITTLCSKGNWTPTLVCLK